MCNIFGVVFFTLFVVSFVECYDENNDSPIETHKALKHHQKSRSQTKDNITVTKITNNDGVDFNTGASEELTSNKDDQEEEKDEMIYSKSSFREEPSTTEENISRTGEKTFTTVFVGSLARENTDSYDYSDSDETDNENSRRSVEYKEKIEPTTEPEEVLIYTPNKKSLSQDAVLDLRARTGNFPSHEKDLSADLDLSDENVSKIDHVPSRDINLRSGYVPPDYVADVSQASDDVKAYNQPFDISNGLTPHYYLPVNTRPEMMHNNFHNHVPKISPRFFNGIHSRELFPQNLNSQELMWREGNGINQRHPIKLPYYGLSPNTQLSKPKVYDRCPLCYHEKVFTQELNFRSGLESNKVETSNGRAVEFDPAAENSYPFTPVQVLEEVQRIPDGPYQEPLGPARLDSQKHIPSSNHDIPLADLQPELGQLSKMLLTFPPLFPRPNTVLSNRRIGLGGLQRINLF